MSLSTAIAKGASHTALALARRSLLLPTAFNIRVLLVGGTVADLLPDRLEAHASRAGVLEVGLGGEGVVVDLHQQND